MKEERANVTDGIKNQPAALLGQSIICLAPAPWKEDQPETNQRVLFGLSGKNRILYVDTRPGKKYRLREEDDNVFVLAPSVLTQRPRLFHLDRLLLHVRLTALRLRFRKAIIWAADPSVKETALALKNKAACLVYFCSTEAGTCAVNVDEISLIKKSDLCLYADALSFELCGALHSTSYCLSPAVEYHHFAEASKPGNRPFDLRSVPAPVAGYAGPLENFDFEGFRPIAKANPAVSFVFAGEIETSLVVNNQAPNVYFLGKKSYEELPYVMRHFDVHCLFLKHEGGYPPADGKRILEYLATGKPVAALPAAAVEKWKEHVYAAETHEEFDEQLREAIMEDEPELPAQRMAAASRATWENTAREAGELVALYLKGTPAKTEETLAARKESKHENAPR